MSEQKNKKKDDSLAGSIILLVCGIIMAIAGENYVWYPFGIVEIPLQIVGVIAAVLGAISTVLEFRKKKSKKEEE